MNSFQTLFKQLMKESSGPAVTPKQPPVRTPTRPTKDPVDPPPPRPPCTPRPGKDVKPLAKGEDGETSDVARFHRLRKKKADRTTHEK